MRAEPMRDGPPRRGDTCRELVSEVLAEWSETKTPDTQGVLSDHPELREYPSLVLDLLYEEYCIRREGGEKIDAAKLCHDTPELQGQLTHHIELYSYLAKRIDASASESQSTWLQPGETWCGYRIWEELGRGAFARVYLASEVDIGGRRVALKVSRGGALEAHLLGKLEHPNIVPIYSVRKDPDGELTLICMPFRGRTTLANVLKTAGINQPLDVSTALQIGMRLADALDHAHGRGVLHLDLKPSNILMVDSSEPLLLDFNLSADRRKSSAPLGGTLPYMSPELLSAFGQPHLAVTPDERSDIFSLAVLLLELLHGTTARHRLIHEIEDTDECAKLLLTLSADEMLRDLRAQGRVSAKLIQLLGKCIAVDPAERLQSMGELAAGLRTELNNSSSTSDRKKRGRVSGLLAMVGCLAVAIILLKPSYHPEPKQVALPLNEHIPSPAPTPPPSADDPDTLWQQAQDYLDQDKPELAADTLHELHTRFPERADVAALLAYCLSRTREHRAADYYYGIAISNGLETGIVYSNRAYSRVQLGQIKEAAAYVNHAIKIDTLCGPAYFVRGVVRLRAAQLDKTFPKDAISDLETAISHNPPCLALYIPLATACVDCAKVDPIYKDKAVYYLQLAVIHGAQEEALLSNEQIRTFCDFHGIRLTAESTNPQPNLWPHAPLWEPQLGVPALARR